MDSRYRDRKTLKSYFQQGDSPTEDQFAELIDSVTNIHEDGKVTATASDGVRLFPAGKSGVAATVFTDDPDQGGSEPLWRIALDGENGLRIQDDKGKTVLTIDRDRNVTVEGTLKAAGYLSGKDGEEESPGSGILKIKADGLWHDLPVEDAAGQPADRCRMYRLSVCYLNRHSRTYSACEAVASHSQGRTACPFFPETLVGLVWPCQDTLATHGRENPSPDKKPVDRERCGGHLLPYRNPLGIIGDRAYG